MNNRYSLKADVMLVGVTLIAATGWVFSKEALAGLPPLLFIGIRFLIAGGVLAIIAGRDWLEFGRSRVPNTVLTGFIMAAGMIFWVKGLNASSHLGESAFIHSLSFILVPLVARWGFGDPQPLTTWIALPVALCGLGLLSLENGFRLENSQLYFLFAAALFAWNICLITRLSGSVRALPLSAVQLLIVGATALLLSLFTEQWPSEVAGAIWGWLLISALVATSLRFFLQVYAQGLTSASHAALIMTLEPVFTALLASMWFAETMSGAQFAGCALVFVAMLVSRARMLLLAVQPFLSRMR